MCKDTQWSEVEITEAFQIDNRQHRNFHIAFTVVNRAELTFNNRKHAKSRYF